MESTSLATECTDPSISREFTDPGWWLRDGITPYVGAVVLLPSRVLQIEMS